MNATVATVQKLQGESRAPLILAGNLVPEILATLFFAARVWSRAWLLKTWGWDDTLLSVSWLGSVVLCICSCVTIKFGSGHHVYDVPSEFFTPSRQIDYASLIIYQLTIALTKASICVFYLRIFSEDPARRIIYLTIAMLFIYTLPTVIFSIFQCHPIAGYWDRDIVSTCLNPTAAFYTNSISNILADSWLIAFVVPRIWVLKMAQKQKLALFAIITLSWLAVIAAIVRLARLSALFQPSSERDADVTWDFYDVSIWTGLEVTTGISCVSAPAMKPIFRRYAPGFLSTYFGRTSRSHTFGTFDSAGRRSMGVSRSKWPRRESGVIELGDSDATWNENNKRSTVSSWATKGLVMGSGLGIVKSTTVSVDVASHDVNVAEELRRESLGARQDSSAKKFLYSNRGSI